ncbi:MAG: hypothetical protein JNL42_00905 [Anaerolineae bacterium]|nr:hypothetical protein [Anaerolineae bacterium]
MFDERRFFADTYCLLAGYRPSRLYARRQTPENSDRRPVRVRIRRGRSWIGLGTIMLLILLACLVTPVAGQCSPPECVQEPPDLPPGESEIPAAPPWDGFSDGRLNPDPGEYYTIYCSSDVIRVIRVVPLMETVKEIPIYRAVQMPVGWYLELGDYMQLVRHGTDEFTIYGSNGNRSPEAGQKAFSLADCIAHNGGSFELVSGGEDAPGDPVSPAPCPDGCPQSSQEILWSELMGCVAGQTFFVFPGAYVLRRRWKNWRRARQIRKP